MARPKKRTQTQSDEPQRKMKPAMTPEAREQQLISLAVDCVERRLIDGTASSQETVHFLKLASSDYKLKVQRLEEENKLLRAKTEQLQSQKKMDELYAEAIKAMRNYGGYGNSEDEDDDEY